MRYRERAAKTNVLVIGCCHLAIGEGKSINISGNLIYWYSYGLNGNYIALLRLLQILVSIAQQCH